MGHTDTTPFKIKLLAPPRISVLALAATAESISFSFCIKNLDLILFQKYKWLIFYIFLYRRIYTCKFCNLRFNRYLMACPVDSYEYTKGMTVTIPFNLNSLVVHPINQTLFSYTLHHTRPIKNPFDFTSSIIYNLTVQSKVWSDQCKYLLKEGNNERNQNVAIPTSLWYFFSNC